ncbi:MAG TPA: TAXI family TRAP transporter solute-binding subunit [Chthoniobacter sp.]|nr:TAXI family TRAP transporter solute-binding subunit [Chthoniobacter sp.]
MPNDPLLHVMERHSNALKTAILFAVLAVITLAAIFYDRTPGLSSVRVKMLSGTPQGNYHAIVDRLAEEAERRHGRIENLSSAGSVENLSRLAAGRTTKEVQFALVQDGLDWPKGQHLELIGRLGDPESFVLLGKDADHIRTLADLKGKRIGIGPPGSGTERVARQILALIPELNLQVSVPSMEEQFAQLQNGELDLGAMVIDENAQALVAAVRERHLQIVDLANADVLAHRLPFARAGVIRAGNYDPVQQWPSEDKHVIQIDTLLIGNGRASWSATQGLITILNTQFPDFVHLNHDQTNRTGLPLASAARSYFDNGGPDTVGVYAPWLVDLMPTARWVQLIFGFSILFNVMGFWNRFRLWRIDAARVHLEGELPSLIAPGVTVREIAAIEPEAGQRNPETRAGIDGLIEKLAQLLERCRKQSLSVLVPMGQEMSYRYQETLIVELLRALRLFRAKLER